MPNKLKRQNRIKEILNDYVISGYDAILRQLEDEGIKITQATLSRDFAEIGVARVINNDKIRYVLDPEETGKQIARLIGLEILNVQHNESMVVVRTIAGRAQGVAHFIDRLNRREIIGTVGGDDTVIVIPDSHNNINKITTLVKELMFNPGKL